MMTILLEPDANRQRTQRESAPPQPPAGEQKARGGERPIQKVVHWACRLYLVFTLSIWLFLRLQGDDWWAATMVLFGPRWVMLLPLAILLPAALAVRPRSLWASLAALGVILFPVMGLSVPWRVMMTREADATCPRVRVLTCNIHRSLLEPKALADLIASTRPDVIAIQEWSSKYQTILFGEGDWHILRDEELCLISRYPIRKIEDIAGKSWAGKGVWGSAVCYQLAMPQGVLHFVNLHLASPHRPFEAALRLAPEGAEQVERNSEIRLRQSQTINGYIEGLGDNTLLAGDFNTPDESSVFGRSWPQFSDAFGVAGWGFGYTYHARWTSVRIDHILSGRGWRARRCWVGPDVGSPHRPLLADLEWLGAAEAR